MGQRQRKKTNHPPETQAIEKTIAEHYSLPLVNFETKPKIAPAFRPLLPVRPRDLNPRISRIDANQQRNPNPISKPITCVYSCKFVSFVDLNPCQRGDMGRPQISQCSSP
jgi:hypothetical protein